VDNDRVTTIPVIDLSGLGGSDSDHRSVVDEVGTACEEVGFFVVSGHGVAPAQIADMYEVTADFFARPLEEKQRCTPIGWDRFCGFAGIAPAATAGQRDGGSGRRGEGGPLPDLKEMYHVNHFDGPDQALEAGLPLELALAQAPNIWPERPFGFEKIWRDYYDEMVRLAAILDAVFAEALGLPADGFDHLFATHLSNLAANWYPPQPLPPIPGQVRASTHIDFSFLTLLYQDDAPGGLEVRHREAGWIPVPPVADSYVVNLGDLINRVTNDRWRATPHRVVNPAGPDAHRSRISIPYFQMPGWDAIVECIPPCLPATGKPHYPPVVAGPHAEERRAGGRAPTAV
jgi:isopenicillin N synthase-like dioxygenase